MNEVIRFKDRFYILATSSLADEATRELKHGETFAVFDRHGDIGPLGFENHGIFHLGTRFLSRHKLTIDNKTPLLLSSTVREDNDLLVVDLTNPDLQTRRGIVRRGDVHIARSLFLLDECCHERISVSNYGRRPVAFLLVLEFEADYRDIFEVRGMKRKKRGRSLRSEVKKGRVTLGYEGLDGLVRKTRIEFATEPQQLQAKRAKFSIRLEPQDETSIDLAMTCSLGNSAIGNHNPAAPASSFGVALQQVTKTSRLRHMEACVVETSNEQFNDWLSRSSADLEMMKTQTAHGPYPYAGIPWFSTIFGRDGIITAFETLWVQPELARGVLAYLAAHQAADVVPEQDAEPGKILHEERQGEMAVLKEIPFGRYYGSIDSTPLFIVLAGHYYQRTGDVEFVRHLWPNIEAALGWIDQYGDSDGDGFVEYQRRSEGGLVQQGWKDSEDSVFHADGTLAEPPVALCEVQGYVYEAKREAAKLADVLGHAETAERLAHEARVLRERFLEAFWCEEQGTYALALDGRKRPCKVRSSNAGQCLFSGIANDAHAQSITEGLLSDSFFSGWGVRTLASSELRYNPMSYHNGSIWPHDNALIAYGMSRYGLKNAVLKLLTGIFDASIFVDMHRLPELYCGFDRRRGEGPTLYPVACDPQAWASASVYLLLQACLGLSIQAHEGKVYFNNPALAQFLQEVEIRNLKVGSATLDIGLRRHAEDVSINVMRKDGEVDVVAVK